MEKLLFVFLGGGLGAALRYQASIWVNGKVDLPYAGTFFVNVLGSFLLGILVGYFSRQDGMASGSVLFLTIGLCGGFTTFSSFSLELFELIKQGLLIQALLYCMVSMTLGVVLVYLGWRWAS